MKHQGLDGCIWVLHFHCIDPECKEDCGFVCSNPFTDPNYHLPTEFSQFLNFWSNQIYKALNYKKILLQQGKYILLQADKDGYKCLKNMTALFHPYLVQLKIKIAPKHPTQICGMIYVEYSAANEFFYTVQGWIHHN